MRDKGVSKTAAGLLSSLTVGHTHQGSILALLQFPTSNGVGMGHLKDSGGISLVKQLQNCL